MKVLVAQKGAREHFGVARALHRQGRLAGLVTDWYAPRQRWLRWSISKFGGSRAQSALAARADEIPDDLVTVRWVQGLAGKWIERNRFSSKTSKERSLEADIAFARDLTALKFKPHDVFFGYSYATLEMLELERSRGVLTLLDQIDPGPAEFRLVAEEMAHFPELAGKPGEFPAAYFERLHREWEQADVIVVNSEWSRRAIIPEGVDSSKIEVLPLAFELDDHPQTAEQTAKNSRATPRGDRLQVLWLGQVNVRKGIHYLVDAARALECEAVDFIIAGPIQVRREYVAAAPGNIRWLGPVPRNQVAELYRRSEVFILPTLSDGFAITQLEAIAHGLPVIATPNCGQVVEEGRTGYTAPCRDASALAECIMKFVKNRGLAESMRPNCLAAVKRYTLEEYGKNLINIIAKRQAAAVEMRKVNSPKALI